MDQNGIKQSPFAEAVCPTPDAGSGDQGIGGGLDLGAGSNGIVSSPMSPVCPTPSGGKGGGPFGNTSKFSTLDGSTHEGENLGAPITEYKRTIDKR